MRLAQGRKIEKKGRINTDTALFFIHLFIYALITVFTEDTGNALKNRKAGGNVIITNVKAIVKPENIQKNIRGARTGVQDGQLAAF